MWVAVLCRQVAAIAICWQQRRSASLAKYRRQQRPPAWSFEVTARDAIETMKRPLIPTKQMKSGCEHWANSRRHSTLVHRSPLRTDSPTDRVNSWHKIRFLPGTGGGNTMRSIARTVIAGIAGMTLAAAASLAALAADISGTWQASVKMSSGQSGLSTCWGNWSA
jgi:hypothetical protein